MANEAKEPAFEQVIARLEAIAEKLEGGDVKLEDALTLFEEGVSLSKVGTRRLDEAERKLEVLLGDGKVEPFEAEAE